MGRIIDKVSIDFADFIVRNGISVIENAVDSILVNNSALILPFLDASNDDPTSVARQSKRLLSEIKAICKEHQQLRLLLLFRKVPLQLTNELIGRASIEKSWQVVPKVTEGAILVGTNCILKYCTRQEELKSYNDRYSFQPTELEFTSALKLMTFSILLHLNNYYLNSLASVVSHK